MARIVGDAHGERSAPFGFAHATQRKRCGAAGGNRDKGVGPADIVLVHQPFGVTGLVFGAFG